MMKFITRGIALSTLMAVIAATFLFNIPFWSTLGMGDGETRTYLIGPGLVASQISSTYTIEDSEEAYIELNVAETTLKNIRLDFDVPDWSSGSIRDSTGPYIGYHVEVKDASSNDYLRLPDSTFQGGNVSSHVIRLNLSSDPEFIRIYIHLQNNEIVKIGNVQINTSAPFIFNPWVFAGIFLVVMTVYILRPSSPVHFEEVRFDSVCSLAPYGLLVAFEIIFVLAVSRLVGVVDLPGSPNIDYDNGVAYDFNQYNYLADAILDGSTTLDLPVSDRLRELENPYDESARHEALAGTGEYYYLDYAYYDGNYYSYFGVLPALVFFAPYKLITGLDLRTDRVVSLLVCIYVIAVNCLIVSGAKRTGKNVTLGAVLLASISAVFSSGLLYLAYLPQLYSVPILMGLVLVFFGLSFWVLSPNANRKDGYRQGYLAGGSFLIALSVACRPQYVLSCLLAFPIFWRGICDERVFFSKRGTVNTLLVILPFVVVALPVMAYNYERFNSIFDFGAAYNLTGSDMTARGIDLSRCIPATFQYLFQPINLTANFPFMREVNLDTNYQGFWFFEPYLGGFFSFCPLAYTLIGVKSWWGRHGLSSKLLVSVSLLISGVILFADYQIASITMRYFNDFSWLLLMAVWYMLFTEGSAYQRFEILRTVIFALVIAGVVFNITALLSPDRYAPLSTTFPSLYYGLESLHQGLL